MANRALGRFVSIFHSFGSSQRDAEGGTQGQDQKSPLETARPEDPAAGKLFYPPRGLVPQIGHQGTAMTPRQTRFVEEYLIDLSAARAARRAGYSTRSAAQRGYLLLRDKFYRGGHHPRPGGARGAHPGHRR